MVNPLVIQNRAMAVGRLCAQTCIDPQTEIGSELPANFGDDIPLELMVKIPFAFFTGNREEQKVRSAVSQIIFDLPQRRRDGEPDIATQSGDGLSFSEAFDDKERLNQLRAIEFCVRAQVPEVLRGAQAHQAFH